MFEEGGKNGQNVTMSGRKTHMYEAKLIPLPLDQSLPKHSPSLFRKGNAATHRILPQANMHKDKWIKSARGFGIE